MDDKDLRKYDDSENKDPIEYYESLPTFETESYPRSELDNTFIKNQLSLYNQIRMSGLLAQKERERAEMWANAMIDFQREAINYQISERRAYFENLLNENIGVLDSYLEKARENLEVEKFDNKAKVLLKLVSRMQDMVNSIKGDNSLDSSLKQELINDVTELFQTAKARIKDNNFAKKYGLA